MRMAGIVDSWLDRLTRPRVWVLATCGVVIVGAADYLTGDEVSMALFYLGPVAIAAWYAGRTAGLACAGMSCVSWYAVNVIGGGQYSNPAIPVWNALVRFGFFLVTALLLAALREAWLTQRYLAQTDGLTAVYGRRAFEDRLRHDLALARRRRSPLTLAYVDLDDFKVINDTRGHAEGDRVLRAVGEVLKRSTRETDTAARVGGDEFALVLPDTDGPAAQRLVARLRRELQAALGVTEQDVPCSIGVVTFLDGAVPLEDAIGAADRLMYEVKRRGKGGVAFSVRAGTAPPGGAAAGPRGRDPGRPSDADERGP